MFAGHFAVGLAAKKFSPRTSLPTLVVAATFLDIIWPPLVLFGIEHVRIDPGNTAVTPLDFSFYPYSHSLVTVLLWSAGFGFCYYFITRYRRGAVVTGLAVASHWLLDLITHRPDLPLAPGAKRYFGLGLWNSVALTALVEVGIFLLAVRLYSTFTRSDSRAGKISLWSFIGFLLLIQVMNYTGTPPPSVEMV
ncbi:MAG: hypothetical protein FVQ81_16575, partial [Candidatus Glassbacteria bacterium]|nr:hypothetical protein [Candidatus Glassbacteria bacterium]